MNQIIELDPETERARVQPGVVLDSLRNAANQHGLTFAPDPSTHNHCTLGGMIGNNSCGVHSVMGGKTDENVEELDILTYDGLRMRVGKTTDEQLDKIIGDGGRWGEIYAQLRVLRDKYADSIRSRYPNIPRRVSGYNLNYLLPENGFDVAKALVGSESTCVMVLEATVRLVHNPPARSLLVLGYEDVYSAADHVMGVLAHRPIGLEGLDDRLAHDGHGNDAPERIAIGDDKVRFGEHVGDGGEVRADLRCFQYEEPVGAYGVSPQQDLHDLSVMLVRGREVFFGEEATPLRHAHAGGLTEHRYGVDEAPNAFLGFISVHPMHPLQRRAAQLVDRGLHGADPRVGGIGLRLGRRDRFHQLPPQQRPTSLMLGEQIVQEGGSAAFEPGDVDNPRDR